MFITVRRLEEVNAALRQAHAWRLVPLVTGTGTGDDLPFDLRTAVRSFLGPRSAITIEDMMATEIGLIARSWSDVADAVWFARVDSKETLDRWFPKDRRRAVRLSPSARFFRTDGGVVACVREEVVAMTRTTGRQSLMWETRRLIAGRGAASLATLPAYRDLVAYLPSRPLAVAYLSKTNQGAATGAAAETVAKSQTSNEGGRGAHESARWWEVFEQAVVGMYARDTRIELAIRGALSDPRFRPALADHAVERMRELPQTTLAAWATRIELSKAFEQTGRTRPLGRLGRYLRLLSGIRARSGTRPDPLHKFGPHVILAWDQDMSGLATPQLAVLVECEQARLLNGEVSRIAEQVINLVLDRDSVDDENAPTIHLTSHLGVPISYVPLAEFAPKSRFAVSKLLRNIEPAWAAQGNWLIIALSRDHLERILDAQMGMAGVLGSVEEARASWERRVDRTMLAVVQTGLASQVLERWLDDSRGGGPSLLNPVSWDGSEPGVPSQSARLGIATRPAEETGTVLVVGVYPGTAASGRLSIGDRIIGIDGELLDGDAPTEDLRRRWADGARSDARVLRVKRGDTTIDVVLESARSSSTLAGLSVSPVDAVRELASVGRAVRFASFEVHETDEKHLSALVSLTFETNDRSAGP